MPFFSVDLRGICHRYSWEILLTKVDAYFADTGVVVKHACRFGRLHTLWMHHFDSLCGDASINVG